MSENGSDSPGSNVIDGVLSRFYSLAGRQRMVRTIDAAPQSPPSPVEIRAAKLGAWLREAPCEAALLPWIDEMIAVARSNTHASRKDHAEVAYWIGVEAGISLFLDEILRIRGQAA